MSLVYMSKSNFETFYIAGIDGGGTKTECAITDHNGQVVGIGRGGPSNINYTELPQVLAAYDEAIRSALGDHAGLSVMAVGCTHRAADQPEVQGIISRLLGGGIRRYSEGEAALASAGCFERYGIAQVAGTGSSTFGFPKDDEPLLVGGWGMVLGDEGGAYDIAVRGLRAAVRAIDGRGPQTALLDGACACFAVPKEREAFVQLSRNLTRDQLASFSVEVAKMARIADSAAVEIIDYAIQELALAVLTMAGKLFDEKDVFPVALHGGVMREDRIAESLKRVIHAKYPKADIRRQITSPGVGLALLALHDFQN